MSYKVFSNGSVLNASELNEFLMNQSVIAFSNATARSSAITSPVEGMITYLEDLNSYQSWDGSAWVGLVPQSGNAIINGAFDIWQRGAGPFTVAGAYTADRWVMELSGATASTSRQTFTPGQTDVPGNPTFFLRYANSVGDNASRIEQRIEDVSASSGRTFTLSFWAKGTNPGGGAVEIFSRQEFGSGGSTGVATSVGTIVLTSSWQRFTKTFTYASVSGKTINAGNYWGIDIRQPGVDTSTAAWTLDLANVQLEEGSVATPFRRNANSIQGELAACQRYFWRTAGAQMLGAGQVFAVAGTFSYVAVQNPVTMRAAPTLAASAAGAISVAVAANFRDSTAISLENAGINAVQLTVTHSAAAPGQGVTAVVKASQFLDFSSEL
jgi:hypothetical protein